MQRITAVFVAACMAAATVAWPAAGVGPRNDATSGSAQPSAVTAALPAHHPTTILVKVADGHRPAAVHRRAGYDVANRIRPLGIDVVAVPQGGVLTALQRYGAMPAVAYAEPNVVVRLSATPNDSMLPDQYALSKIRARRGWDRYGRAWRASGGARIAIIDSGIDQTHPEFSGKVTHCRSWLTGLGVGTPGCQDLQVHGTHVAGIAAAKANNGAGIAGVAFDAEIMALQAFNSTGSALSADLVAAMVYAVRNGADVANYSFGGRTDSQAQRDAVRLAARRGIVQVAAAGNTGTAGVDFPARLGRVIAVAATDDNDARAGFSSFGRTVELAAPGDLVLSTVPGSVLYMRMSGTSMAAPHVAGLAALLRAKGYTPAQTRRRLRTSARDLGPEGRDREFGYGLVNAARSLR
jgi:thermitase